MSNRDDQAHRDELRQRLIGLGEKSIKKSYYPELQKRLNELERFREVLDHASDTIFLADAETGHIADLNRTATKLTGYTRQELMGRSLFGLFDHGLAVRSVGSEPVITKLKTATGKELPVELSLWFRSFSRADYVVCIVRDVSARLKAEAERELLFKELEEKNKELEQFLYTASHDLKTPMTTVMGYTGKLRHDLEKSDQEAVDKDLRHIETAAAHMLALLGDVIEISRIGSSPLKRTRLDLAVLAREAVGLVDARLKEFGVEVRILPGLPTVGGDRNRVLQIFQNLLDNAAKYSRGEGSTVTISASLPDNGGNEMPIIRVADQGIGIDPRYHDNVFGLFNQLDPTRPGTGIGLTVVKRVVELHGGHIWVEANESGTGTTFCFTLGRALPPEGTY